MALINKPKLPVETYGLYKDDDKIYWLLQQGVAQNAIGLSDKNCPFRIKTHLKLCTHKFDLSLNLESDISYKEYEFLLPNSPLLQAFDPIYLLNKKDNISTYFISSKFNNVVKAQQLLNPVHNYAVTVSLAKDHVPVILKRLQSSNLANYVVYGFQPEDLNFIDKLAKLSLAYNGKLILIGQNIPLYNTKELINILKVDSKTDVFLSTISSEKLRMIGSYRIKKFMRS